MHESIKVDVNVNGNREWWPEQRRPSDPARVTKATNSVFGKELIV